MFNSKILSLIVIVLGLVAMLLIHESRSPQPGGGIEATRAPPEATAADVSTDETAKIVTTDPEPVSIEAPLEGNSEPTVTISGRVGNQSGTGLAGVAIEFESHGFDGEQVVATTAYSDHRGGFRLEGLVPGRQYKLEIEPSGDYAGFSLDSFTSSTIDALQNIQLERIALVDVDGMIVDTNQAPVANFELSVASLVSGFPDRVIRSDSTGYFKLKGFPAGEIRIATNASDYYRIKGLSLRPDEYRNLLLVIDRGNFHLAGTVIDENSMPLEEAQVTLKSAFAMDDYHSYSYRTTATDANGYFEFAELGGHSATLGVYASGYKTHIERHEFQTFSDSLQIRLVR